MSASRRLGRAPAIAAPGLALALAAAGPGDAAFERTPASPEAAALGGVVALAADPVFGNPAAVPPGDPAGSGPTRRRLRLEAWVSRPFGLEELGEGQLSLFRSGGLFGLGAGFRRFGSSAYAERELRVAASARAGTSFALGAALRALSVSGSGFSSRRSLALDAGIRVRADPGTEMGIVVESALGRRPGDEAGELRRTAIGVARRVTPALVGHLEVQRREDRKLAGVFGITWHPSPFFAARVGGREDPLSLAWGFTARLRGLALTGAVTHLDSLGRTVRVGLVVAPGSAPPTAGPDVL